MDSQGVQSTPDEGQSPVTHVSQGDATRHQQQIITADTNQLPILDVQQQMQPITSSITVPQTSFMPKIDPQLDQSEHFNQNLSTNSQPSTINVEAPPPQTNTSSESQPQTSPQKAVVTKVNLTDELNIFDWFKTTDIIQQIAEKARSSVDSVITALDPGMKEYLYSGGNVNIMVISDSGCAVSPIRDAFQFVFGRATVTAARYNPPDVADDYPIKTACGFNEAIVVCQEKIKRLRLDKSNVPQNQVVVVVQPTLVSVVGNDNTGSQVANGLSMDETLQPRWFLTYCMLIEDPVLGATMSSYSQFIPIETETVTLAKEAEYPPEFQNKELGFCKSIDELMTVKLKLPVPGVEDNDQSSGWVALWAGLYETQIIHQLSLSLANLYRRKWKDCVS